MSHDAFALRPCNALGKIKRLHVLASRQVGHCQYLLRFREILKVNDLINSFVTLRRLELSQKN